MTDYPVTIAETLSWDSQVRQYPVRGEPGIGYFAGDVSHAHPGKPPIHCLLYRDENGYVVGILNYYEVDYPPWEEAGNVNVFVKRQNRRQGIGTRLVDEAKHRWGISHRGQRYSAEGAALAAALDDKTTTKGA